MEALLAKLKHFWYYYKIPTGIVLCVLIVWVYLSAQSAATPDPDYHIGLVSTTSRSDEALAALENTFAAAGEDRNSDGDVLVRLHTYALELGENSDYANNYEIVAALDADLVGSTSGLFLLDDPEAFQSVTNGRLDERFLPFREGLYLCIRSDASEEYQQLFEAFQKN